MLQKKRWTVNDEAEKGRRRKPDGLSRDQASTIHDVRARDGANQRVYCSLFTRIVFGLKPCKAQTVIQ